MRQTRITAFAAALMVAATPAAAAVLDGKTKIKASETIGPAAAGDRKPYFVRVTPECDASTCTFNFGKRGNRVRTIEWINCSMLTTDGVTRIGLASIDTIANTHGFFSVTSDVTVGAQQTAVLEYKNRIIVAPGETLLVMFATTAPPGGGVCSAGGTIE